LDGAFTAGPVRVHDYRMVPSRGWATTGDSSSPCRWA